MVDIFFEESDTTADFGEQEGQKGTEAKELEVLRTNERRYVIKKKLP